MEMKASFIDFINNKHKFFTENYKYYVTKTFISTVNLN